MTTVIKCCRGEKVCRGIRAVDGFRKKLMNPDSESPKNLKLNQKQEKFFRTIIPLKNILLEFMKLILIFYENYDL